MNLLAYKNGTFSYERRPYSGYPVSNINITKARKEYWENLIGKDGFSLEKYWDKNTDEVLSLLDEHEFIIDMNDDLREWENLVECIENGSFDREPLPEFKWNNPQNGELENDPPFLAFLIPFLKYSVGMLRGRINEEALTELYRENVEKDVLSILVSHLYSVCYRVLILELNVCREQGMLQGDTSVERMSYYSQKLLCDREYRKSILEEYPVMYRLLSISIHNWIRNITDLFTAFKKDRSRIGKIFFDGAKPELITGINGNISDSHNGGKSVFIVTIDDDKKIIYKPRSLKLDITFNRVLEWYNSKKPTADLYTVTYLDKESYGWMEFISNKKCDSEEDLNRYFYKVGVLLFLLYSTRTTDIHYENIIASGSDPVVIDLEAMFHNRLDDDSSDGANKKIIDIIEGSVRRVGILPKLSWSSETGDGVDLSALGGNEDQTVPIQIPIIKDAMSDEIRIGYGNARISASGNSPTDKKINVFDYKNEIHKGFYDSYKLLVDEKNKTEFLQLLRLFDDIMVRQILRDTQQYSFLLNISNHPDYLRSALDREMLFSSLYKDAMSDSKYESIADFELREMLNGDVPFFSCYPHKRTVINKYGSVDDFFRFSCMELVVDKIKNLSPEDYLVEKRFIDLSFAGDKEESVSRIVVKKKFEEEIKEIRQKALRIATNIGKKLVDEAIFSDDKKEANWIVTNVVGVKETQWSIEAAGLDLYNGLSGILLFLAENYHVTRDEKVLDVLQKGLNTFRRAIKEDYELTKQRDRELTFGGFSGETSVIGVLIRLGEILNEDFRTEYDHILEMISSKISHDKDYDIVSGTSGCILQLINLYTVTGDHRIPAILKECGDHLLSSAEEKEGMLLWKPTCSSNPLAGYSHGAAGIAVALMKLSKLLGDARYYEAAIKSLKYERSLFVEKEGNWADIRMFEGESNFDHGIIPVAWCHGAAGVLLSRVQMLKYVNNEIDKSEIENELKIALNTTMFKGFGSGHCMCHGDMGNLDILLYAYQHIHDEKIRDFIYSYIDEMMPDFEKMEFKCGVPGQNTTDGFMLGLSGIGYEFLRVFDNTIPSVLSLEYLGV